MKISVLMASYNGEKYIYSQLKSIYDQTRKPDEIIICDDCSKDSTLEVVKKFKNDYPDLNIITSVNEHNLGYAANFFRAATLSTGELLFFSDQDDIWLPEKIRQMSSQFENNDDIGGLVCDFELIDGNSQLIGKHKNFSESIQVSKVSINKMVRTFNCGGLNFAVRRNYVDKYKNYIMENGMSHDVPLGIIISSQEHLYRINQVYVQHRVHSNNATKPEYGVLNRLGNVEKQIKAARNKLKWLEKCKDAVKNSLSNREMKYYIGATEYYKDSLKALESKNVWQLVKLCFLRNPMIDRRIAIFNVVTIILPKRKISK